MNPIEKLARKLAYYGTSPSQSAVIRDNKKFGEMIENSKTRPQMVLFSANWCGYCQRLKPTWKEVKNTPSVTWKTVNCNRETEFVKQLRNTYNVRGFPTIMRFSNGVPSEYNGERTTEAIRKFATGS